LEKSGGGGDAADGCCANSGPDHTMMDATTAIPTLFIPTPL
jgi:hypothetical protein